MKRWKAWLWVHTQQSLGHAIDFRALGINLSRGIKRDKPSVSCPCPFSIMALTLNNTLGAAFIGKHNCLRTEEI